MRNYKCRAKRVDNGEWVEGYYVCIGKKYHYIYTGKINLIVPGTEKYLVVHETVGQYTGIKDDNGAEIYEGDIVRVLDANNEELMRGRIVFACGAYGLYLVPYIDWEKLENLIAEITGCDNSPCFCYNDNFISLWELCWNFCNDVDYDNCPVLEKVEK